MATQAQLRQREIFLAELATTGNVTKAAHTAGYSRRGVYNIRDAHPEFAAAWDEAMLEAADRLEAEAHRRAVEGVAKPLYYQGHPIYLFRDVLDPATGLPERDEKGRVRREIVRGEDGQPIQAREYQYSDGLLTLLLKANVGHKFRDRQEIVGADGGPVRIEMSDTEKARRVAFLLAKGLRGAQADPEPDAPPDDGSDLI